MSQVGNYQAGRKLTFRNLPEWLRHRFSDAERYMLIWAFTGVVCGLAAVLFHIAIEYLFEAFMGLAHSLEGWGGGAILLFGPALGGLLGGLIIHFACPQAAGSGIPQTKARYYREFGVFRLREAAWRFLAGTLSVGMGMSLGREGPTVHICAAIASKIGQVFGLAKKRVQAMVPVGMGAGIAAAFNAPIAAMFFVYEELLGDFSTKALFGILVAVVIAATLVRVILGENPAFDIQLPPLETAWWMLLCLPLAVMAAFIGHFFVGGLLWSRGRMKRQKLLPKWLLPGIGGLGVGIMGLSIYLLTAGRNGVFGIGYRDLSDTLNGQLTILSVLLALFAGKFIASILAYASGGSGGLFAPTLFLGGMLGAMVGMFGQFAFGLDETVVGALAVLGMGAFFAAVIRCPMTSIMIIFEMTRNYHLILPLMMGNIIAYLLASKWRPVALYDSLLLQDRVNLRRLPNYRGEQDWRNLPVSTITTFEPITLQAETTIAEALVELDGHRHHAYPVLDAGGRLQAMVTHHELEEARSHGKSGPVGDLVVGQKLVTLQLNTSIRDAANTLVVKDKMQAPVVSKDDERKLLGVLTLHDIARQQNAIDDSLERD